MNGIVNRGAVSSPKRGVYALIAIVWVVIGLWNIWQGFQLQSPNLSSTVGGMGVSFIGIIITFLSTIAFFNIIGHPVWRLWRDGRNSYTHLRNTMNESRTTLGRDDITQLEPGPFGTGDWILECECRDCGATVRPHFDEPPVSNKTLADPAHLVTMGSCARCDSKIVEAYRWSKTPSPVTSVDFWFRVKRRELRAVSDEVLS